MRNTPLPQEPNQPAARRRAIFVGVVLACVVAAGLLGQRGVARGLSGSLDLTMIYAGARQLAHGENPYDFDGAYDTFAEAGGTGRARDPYWFALLYPPFTYAVMSPLGLLDWPAARVAWMAVNMIAVGAIGGWLYRHRRHGAQTPAHPWIVAGGIAALLMSAAVVHTALALGQLSLVTFAFMLAVLGPDRRDERWTWRDKHVILAGLLLSLAGAVKPQLLAPVAIFLLATPRWRAVVWGMGFGLVIAGVSVAWVQQVDAQWLTDWRAQLSAFVQTGQADPLATNFFTFQMIHLEPWLHRLWPGGSGPAQTLRLVSVLLPVALMVAAMIRVRARLRERSDATLTENATTDNRWRDEPLLLGLALVCVLTLLMAYHRTYDAILLVVPALWVWRQWAGAQRGGGVKLAAVCLALFMLPGPAILGSLVIHGHLPTNLGDLWLWRALILPHHNVALVVLAGVLSARLFRR
ncbi:MAG: glycosyltransferase family 87 protein [Planctomycetota bacterium]